MPLLKLQWSKLEHFELLSIDSHDGEVLSKLAAFHLLIRKPVARSVIRKIHFMGSCVQQSYTVL